MLCHSIPCKQTGLMTGIQFSKLWQAHYFEHRFENVIQQKQVGNK